MIPEIKRILYATDLSENARYAFNYAASIANRFGGLITVFHVIEDLPQGVNAQLTTILGKEKWQEMKKDNEGEVLNVMRSRLETFCDDMGKELTACPFIVDRIIVKQGNSVEEILFESKSTDYDLVVMGSHGYGMFGNALMGSTSRRVVRRSKKPVLIIRIP